MTTNAMNEQEIEALESELNDLITWTYSMSNGVYGDIEVMQRAGHMNLRLQEIQSVVIGALRAQQRT